MTYKPVLKPYPHQVEARKRMRGQKAFALLMEMRTGKTKVIMDDWGEMEDAGEVRDLLYVSPGGALYGEDALETQVPMHMPPELRERALIGVWKSGSGKAAQEQLAKVLASRDPRRPRVLLMNVEALSSVPAAREAARLLLEPHRAVMVVGESTCIKGKSIRTGHVLELGEFAPYRRIETGLVAPHSPLDLFYQFNFLNPKILRQHSWFGFRARYAITREVCFLPAIQQEQLLEAKRRLPMTKIVVAYRNEEELAELIEPYSYRKRFRDCTAVPAGVYRLHEVQLTAEQKRMYHEFKEYATTAIIGAEAHMTATVALTQILRLHQLVCGFTVDDEGGGIHDVPENRTRALIGLLEEAGGQAVIWCTYNHNIERIAAALQEHFGRPLPGNPAGLPVAARFYGGNAKTRVEEEAEFKAGTRRFMIANPAAGGKGRDWKNANFMVYYSNGPNLEHRDQSEARIEAVKKLDTVVRVDLCVRKTPDEKMIQNLRAKIDMASTLQGDGYREWLI